MDEKREKIIVGTSLLLLWFLISQYLGEWITRNYYIIETISLLLIFGLVYEVWTASRGKDDFLNMLISVGDEFNRTTAQFLLLFGVSSLVISSIIIRDYIEAQFGPLAVVQLLAVVAIISRMFVNVRATGDPLEILDGTRETYLVYAVGILAIILSILFRDTYHPSTSTHNAVVIFLSTVIPGIYLYAFTDDNDLPSLRDIVDQD